MKHHLLFLLMVATANAANICVGPTSSGSGNGSDWNNKAQWSSVTLTRGNVYYLEDGTYAGRTFNTAASGTQLITILKATVAAHVTDTGWTSTMGDGQAIFTGAITVSTSYWVFDGVTGTFPSETRTDYGFDFGTGRNDSFYVYNVSAAITNVTISHVASAATSSDVEKIFLKTHNQTREVHNVTISHCLINGFGNAYWATSDGLDMNNWVFEYNVCLNLASTGANHGEWINNNYGHMIGRTTRFNLFKNGGNGATGVVVANNTDTEGDLIYGNIVTGMTVSNGVFTGTSAGQLNNARIYNNTIISTSGGSWLGPNASPGTVAQNNLLYNMNASPGNSGTARSFNAYFSCTSSPSETNGQIGTGNPFVNLASGNYALTTNTTAGTPLASPFNVDMLGNIRSSWTRGAIEFVTGGDPPPTVASVVIQPSGTSAIVTFSEAVTFGAGGSGGFSLTMTGGTVTLSSPSGSGTTRTYSIVGRTIGQTETGTVSYTQPGNGVEDSALQDLANFSGSSLVTNNSTVQQVAQPVFSPVTGSYFGTQSVTITSTPGSTIRYTTDGTDPTASSTLYSTALPVSASANLKAKAFLATYLDSPIGSAAYEIGTWTSTAAWKNFVVPQQTGTFTWSFRASASSTTSGGLIGLAPSTSAAQADLAQMVRFGPTGTIQARNNATFAAVNTFNYTAGTSYDFVFTINLANSTYSMTVAQIGGSPVTIADNYTNNATAIGITEVDNVGISVPTSGTVTVSQMSFGTVTGTIPTLTSATIGASGTNLTLVFSVPVVYGIGGNGGWTINASGGAATLTPSTSPTAFTISRAIAIGETGTISYVQPVNGVEATTGGGDLASRSGFGFSNQSTVDLTAPTPNPSTFSIVPTATSTSTITMTATTSTDANSGPVQYFFNETSGNAGGSDSGWQPSPVFSDTGLAAGTQYTYRVRTRDSASTPNITSFSSTMSATTQSVAGAHPASPFNVARANLVMP